jgi:hypothetical protein
VRDVRIEYSRAAIARLLLGAIAVVATSVSVAHAATPSGTWQGRFVYPMEAGNIPTSAYPTAKLTISASSVKAQFHGRTQAAHDALPATSTCSMTFRLRQNADRWRLYIQVGRAMLVGPSTGGMPDLSPCQGISGALRLRSAGVTKIVAEYVADYRPDDGFGEGRLRAFLHR